MGLRTPLYQAHADLGARMVDFGGWDMPVNYGSQIEEHHAVRRDAGMFDVSHMCVIDLEGAGVRAFLERLVANDVAKLQAPGKALYTCMLLDSGGIIDDLIVYYLRESWFRLVVNAGTRDKDLAWITEQARASGLSVRERKDLAMIAVQGPNARAKVAALLGDADRALALQLQAFFGAELTTMFVGRTGYTGEDGFELVVPAENVLDWWHKLRAAKVACCGLGARDTLRLEAGMNLYGSDMDETTSPLESGLTWTVAFDRKERAFVGRAALEAQRAAGIKRKLVGLVLEDRGVLRGHQKVQVAGVGAGEITSGTYAPTLERSIALARVPAATGERVEVDIRGRLVGARVVRPPFVRNGKSLLTVP
ncbi:MAG: glycine cleavage system aminomethyltransferase GcvT [Steroidobacterales bacterium]